MEPKLLEPKASDKPIEKSETNAPRAPEPKVKPELAKKSETVAPQNPAPKTKPESAEKSETVVSQKTEPKENVKATTPSKPTPRTAQAEKSKDPPTKSADLNKQQVREVLHGEGYNRRTRGRSPEEKRQSYARYRLMKKRVADLESRNRQYLVLWPASDIDTNVQKFYNFGGISAVIYVHEIAPRIHRKATLRIDMDNTETKFKTGICSISNVDALEQKLAGIGVKRIETRGEYQEIIIFKLNREYPESEVKEMLKQEQKRVDNLNKLLYAKVLYPDIHKQIIELEKMVPQTVKNMDNTYRQVIGMRAIDALMEIVVSYSRMTHGDMEELEAARKMMLEADALLEVISIMNELRLWEISRCTRMGSVIVGMKKLLKGDIINKYEIAQ